MVRRLLFVTVMLALCASAAWSTQIPAVVNYSWIVEDLSGWKWNDQGTSPVGNPAWQANNILHVPNEARDFLTKTLWLEVTFKDLQSRGLAVNLPIFQPASVPAGSSSSNAWPEISPSNPLIVTWTWTISPQPSWEDLPLDNANWSWTAVGGDNAVQMIRVASLCTPEPGSLAAMASGLVILVGLKRRRR